MRDNPSRFRIEHAKLLLLSYESNVFPDDVQSQKHNLLLTR